MVQIGYRQVYDIYSILYSSSMTAPVSVSGDFNTYCFIALVKVFHMEKQLLSRSHDVNLVYILRSFSCGSGLF